MNEEHVKVTAQSQIYVENGVLKARTGDRVTELGRSCSGVRSWRERTGDVIERMGDRVARALTAVARWIRGE